MEELSALDKLRRAIIRLQRPQPFFAQLLLDLVPREMPEGLKQYLSAQGMEPTMGVDVKGKLWYDEKFVQKMSQSELFGVVLHEVLHVALLHPISVGSRDRMIANVAQDVIVNMMVKRVAQETGEIEIKLPNLDGGVMVDVGSDVATVPLKDEKQNQILIRDVSKKTWEEVYAELLDKVKMQQQQQQQKSGSGSSGGVGSNMPEGFDNHLNGQSWSEGSGSGGKMEQLSQQEKQRISEKWKARLVEAANSAKMQGKLPGGLERVIDGLLQPKISWKALLLKHLKPHFNPIDWTYSRPNKKSKVLGVYLPSVVKESVTVEVIVDTSGSIGAQELKEFLSEIVGIATSMAYVEVWVSFVDTKIQERYKVENGDIQKIMSVTPKGGGGTDMECGLKEIKEKRTDASVAVVLTDGYTGFEAKRSDFPFEVIWVISKDGISEDRAEEQINYGTIIKMD